MIAPTVGSRPTATRTTPRPEHGATATAGHRRAACGAVDSDGRHLPVRRAAPPLTRSRPVRWCARAGAGGAVVASARRDMLGRALGAVRIRIARRARLQTVQRGTVAAEDGDRLAPLFGPFGPAFPAVGGRRGVRLAGVGATKATRCRCSAVQAAVLETRRMATTAAPRGANSPRHGATVFIGIGSNLGDRYANIRRALLLLSERVHYGHATEPMLTSFLYDTAPARVTDQPRFLNCAVRVCGCAAAGQQRRGAPALMRGLRLRPLGTGDHASGARLSVGCTEIH